MAILGVCSAGFATTVFPAISAAVTCPKKIASGKFQGEIAAKTPRPNVAASARTPALPHACPAPRGSGRDPTRPEPAQVNEYDERYAAAGGTNRGSFADR